MQTELASCIARHSADKTVCYKTVAGEALSLALFLPQGKPPLRTLLLIHGGGWRSRKIFEDQSCWQGDYLGFLARYFADRGWLCACIDYRLMRGHGQEPGFGLAELTQDCVDAAAYLLENAEEFGADPRTLSLLGESAGGYLAARASLALPVHSLILVNPITDLTIDDWSSYAPENWSFQERSAAHLIRQDMPQTLLLHGTDDTVVLPEHSKRFAQKMLEAGNPCALHFLEHARHAFLLAEYYPGGTDCCETAMQIIQNHLNSEGEKSL